MNKPDMTRFNIQLNCAHQTSQQSSHFKDSIVHYSWNESWHYEHSARQTSRIIDFKELGNPHVRGGGLKYVQNDLLSLAHPKA